MYRYIYTLTSSALATARESREVRVRGVTLTITLTPELRWGDGSKGGGGNVFFYLSIRIFIYICIYTLAAKRAELARSSSALATAQESRDVEMMRTGEEVIHMHRQIDMYMSGCIYICLSGYIYISGQLRWRDGFQRGGGEKRCAPLCILIPTYIQLSLFISG